MDWCDPGQRFLSKGVGMAEGRDLGPRSPRWVNALIWSTGLGAVVCFIWHAVLGDAEPTCMPVGLVSIVSRVVGWAMLPALLVLTAVGREARKAPG